MLQKLIIVLSVKLQMYYLGILGKYPQKFSLLTQNFHPYNG